MRVKKSIIIILTLITMILPMMTINVKAVNLGRVYNLSSKMQGNIVYFSWTQVTGADGYELYINTSNKGYEYIGSVNGAQVSVIGFQENNTYTAKVCAYKTNSNGTKEVGGFSDEIRVNTIPETALGKVATLTAVQNGGNVTLNWSKVNYADGYQVFVNIPNFGFVNIGSVNTTSAIITGFEQGQTYSFKVRAYENINSERLNYGEYSPIKSIIINKEKYEDHKEYNDEVQKTEQVTGLTINSISGNKAYISWKSVSDAQGYEIYLSKSNGKYQYIDTVHKNSATLSNLDYDTNYRVIVVSYKNTSNGTIYGNDSDPKSFRTGQEEITLTQVQNVTVKVEENNAYVNWEKINNAQGYEIWLKRENGYYEHIRDVYTNSATISNLSYDSNYSIIVAAFRTQNNMRKKGQDSYVKTFTTPEKVSDLHTVTKLFAEVINRNEVELVWWEVEGAEGYEVYLSEEGNSYQMYQAKQINYTTLYNLKYNTNYRVKVIAYKYVNGKKVYSKNYSEVKSFKTELESFLEGNEEISRVQNLTPNVVGDTVYLTWAPVTGAVKYEIYFTVPGLGGMTFTTYTNSRTISGLTKKEYKYSARVRAYKYIDGKLVPGPYSYISEFNGK